MKGGPCRFGSERERGGESWKEAQNKMDIVLVRNHSVAGDFDITSMYEEREGERDPLERDKDGKGNREDKWRYIPANLCVCVSGTATKCCV